MAHSDQQFLSRAQGRGFNLAANIGLLTNSGVAAADTLVGLQNFMQSVTVHSDQVGFKNPLKRSVLANQNEVTDATVLGLTTVAGLVALTQQGTNTSQASLFLD